MLHDDAALRDRFQGCLLGLAIGDALGSHFEGQSRDSIQNRYPSPQALIDNPPRPPWNYTDDTQMAMGVAEALLDDGEIVEETLCQRFAANYDPRRGYGRGARVILDAILEGQDYQHWANALFPGGSFGNGAAMRVAPIGLRFFRDTDRLWEQARLSALPTHVHPLGIEGAQLVALAVALCLRTEPFERPSFFAELRARAATDEYRERLARAAKVQSPDDLLQLGNGIAALDSAVTAIACFSLWPDSYEQVICNAILLGGDTDTIAAMAGAISGSFTGIPAIPAHFLDCLEGGRRGRRYLTKLAAKMAARVHLT